MAVNFDEYSFFDGTSMTPVTQTTWANYWKGVIPDGVIANIGEELKPYGASIGMNIIVGSGAIMIDNHRAVLNTETRVAIKEADPTYPRIDALVARINYGNEDESYIELDVLEGTAENDPECPTVTQVTGGVYEVKLAEISVGVGVLTINAEDVSDTRYVYKGGQESYTFTNKDSEELTEGDIVMLDNSAPWCMKRCTKNQPPIGVVTSNVVGVGSLGKVETRAGNVAYVKCDEKAVAIGDALCVYDKSGMARPYHGYAIGVAMEPKASGIIDNVKSLILCYTKLSVQNKWWVPSDYDESNIIAAYRFVGVGSQEDSLENLQDSTLYKLSPVTGSGDKIAPSWNSLSGWSIYVASTGGCGLNNAALNGLGDTIVACSIGYSGYDKNVSAGQRHILSAIGNAKSNPTRSLYINKTYTYSWQQSHWTDGAITYYSSEVKCQNTGTPGYGKFVADGILSKNLDTNGVIGTNYTETESPVMYIDGQTYSCKNGGNDATDGVVGIQAYNWATEITLGSPKVNKSAGASSTYNITSAVFFKTALTAAQFAELHERQLGLM